eukprot:SAG31_NODE_2786_length_5092_cov_3.254556_6_plen_333_part_00
MTRSQRCTPGGGSRESTPQPPPQRSLREVANAATSAADIVASRPGSIVVEWDPAAVELAFDSRFLVLASPHLLDGVYTDIRIASLVWVDPAGFDLLDDGGEPVAATQPTAVAPWRRFELQVGRAYSMRLHVGEERRLRQRGEVRYGKLYGLLGGEPPVKALSVAFYRRVFAASMESFRGAFATSAGSAERAASNQAEWFAAYWGRDTPPGEGTVVAALEARTRGALVQQLLPKHGNEVMQSGHAVLWLSLMNEAVEEVLLRPKRGGEGTSRSSNANRARVLAEAVMRFCLHFLAFFDFTPRQLLLQRLTVQDWLEALPSGDLDWPIGDGAKL